MCCRLSEVELCDNLMLLILAGHDTSRCDVCIVLHRAQPGTDICWCMLSMWCCLF